MIRATPDTLSGAHVVAVLGLANPMPSAVTVPTVYKEACTSHCVQAFFTTRLVAAVYVGWQLQTTADR